MPESVRSVERSGVSTPRRVGLNRGRSRSLARPPGTLPGPTASAKRASAKARRLPVEFLELHGGSQGSVVPILQGSLLRRDLPARAAPREQPERAPAPPKPGDGRIERTVVFSVGRAVPDLRLASHNLHQFKLRTILLDP